MSWCFGRASWGGGALCVAMSNGGVSAECVYTHPAGWKEIGRATLRVAGEVGSASRGQTCAGGIPFFLRVARDSRTPTRTGSTRACQSESARGFRESYRILRPAKLPLTTDAHARRHADAPQTELSGRGRRGVLRVLVSYQFWKFSSIHIFRETKRPTASRSVNKTPRFIRKPRACCSVMFAVR